VGKREKKGGVFFTSVNIVLTLVLNWRRIPSRRIETKKKKKKRKKEDGLRSFSFQIGGGEKQKGEKGGMEGERKGREGPATCCLVAVAEFREEGRGRLEKVDKTGEGKNPFFNHYPFY